MTCIDRRDQTTQNNLSLSPGLNVNFDGEYTLNQIDVFANELAQNILENSERNPIQIAVNRYGDSFYEANNYLNGTFRQLIGDRLGNFPEAEKRFNRGDISTLELADFIETYNYTPQGVIDQTDYLKLLREINGYYKDSFASNIMGGFCNTLQNIFSQIDAFYDLVGAVAGIINDALSLITKIQNFEGFPEFALQAFVREIIEKIKKLILDTIDEVIQAIEDAIANFDILQIIADIENAPLATVKSIMTTKEQLCAFFTEDNKRTIKDKVSGLIDYTISLFENPGLEQIQYMAFRFCALATNIEALFKDIKRPLDDYGSRFQRIGKRMQNISNINTSTAIQAGAIRYSSQSRREAINRLRALWSGEAGKRITASGEEPINIKPIVAKEYQDLPKCGKVFKGEDSRIKLEGAWVADLGITGYTRIDLDVKVYLMRVQAEIGGTFTITRGWYSNDYNDEINGDPEDSHLSGFVVDIKNEGFDTEAFIESALRNGFQYVIVNENSIHLDIREVPR
jgi:hypothetical protein